MIRTPVESEPVDPDDGVRLGAPAYFCPGPLWAQTLAAGPSLRFAVINPGDGPGLSYDPAYAATATAAEAAGVHLLGYVPTCWGSRPRADVLRDVRRYRDWYGLTGVFLDEASTSVEGLRHYAELTDAVRCHAAGSVVALNPGVTPDEGYAAIADLLLVFEGSWAAYARWSPPTWRRHHPRARFWHVVYATPPQALPMALDRARSSGAELVYVTDRALDNPWDGLPSYWAAEVTAVAPTRQQRRGSPKTVGPCAP